MIDHKLVKLGKRVPRLDKRTLQFSDYKVKAGPIAVPSADGYITEVPDWPMYGNDSLGDCVAAGAGHCIEQWTTYAGSPYLPTQKEILDFYATQNPGGQDNGMDILTALNTWRQQGVGKHKIDAYVSVDPTNQKEIEEAIYLFGNVYIGVALPISAQGQSVFAVPSTGPFGNGSPGSWGGHCIMLPGYRGANTGRPEGTMCVTWGQLMPVTWNFLAAYCDEAYAILSPDWINSKGLSASNFNLSQLTADLKAVTK